MNVEIGTDTPIFPFWEYLFRNFGILSLQCTDLIIYTDSGLAINPILAGVAAGSNGDSIPLDR
jgi:hypothetical protein